jgi:hypothetical protein
MMAKHLLAPERLDGSQEFIHPRSVPAESEYSGTEYWRPRNWPENSK